jgi:hypothetical protein
VIMDIYKGAEMAGASVWFAVYDSFDRGWSR